LLYDIHGLFYLLRPLLLQDDSTAHPFFLHHAFPTNTNTL